MIPYQIKFILREWMCRYHDDRDTLMLRDGDGRNVFESIFSTVMPVPGLDHYFRRRAWETFEQRVIWFCSIDSWGLWRMYLEEVGDAVLEQKFRSYRSAHFGPGEGEE